MSSITGKNIKVSVFGQSHSAALGVTIDGLPAGIKLDFAAIDEFIARRKPDGKYTTARKETDEYEILCGVADGMTCGAPLTAIFRNADTRSGDYDELRLTPRPGHADYTAYVKYGGFNDYRGGGHFSGRLTLALCFAGAVCMQILNSRNIRITSHIGSIGDVDDEEFNETCDNVRKEFPTISKEAEEKMLAAVYAAKAEGDSLGGVIECAIVGLPVGVGEPMFDGMESRIAAAVFSVPAVKGVEFGSGFRGSRLKGSENNDAFCERDGKIVTKTNNHGGILGGISSGMPVVFRAAFKPTPSIAKEQDSVRLDSKESRKLIVKGRHDPCVVLRVAPVVEAVTACVIADMLED